MQTLKRIECGQSYAINGARVTAANVLAYGSRVLAGLQVIHFLGDNGKKYRATQWPDGTIYRIKNEE